MMKVALVGTGYSSAELIRLLLRHPLVELTKVFTHSQGGKELIDLYPHLISIADFTLDDLEMEDFPSDLDLIFLGTPAGVSGKLTPKLIERGLKVIDLSGDFRLEDSSEFERWYHLGAPSKPATKPIYGLSEIYRNQIKEAELIANPGCYPTATLLALIPALKKGMISAQGIIIDAKSGVSGAGRGVSQSLLYSEVNENLKAYKVGNHQHIPEIEQELGRIKKEKVQVTFIPHLVPMTRGILVTIYAKQNQEIDREDILRYYKEFYRDDPFIRIREPGSYPATKEVYGSNYCDIGIHVDERSGNIIFFAAIDNLVKGAAGQAIQNMNLMLGLREETGLMQIPLYP